MAAKLGKGAVGRAVATKLVPCGYGLHRLLTGRGHRAASISAQHGRPRCSAAVYNSVVGNSLVSES